MKPKVLVVVRWPVGGIRTWCRYVYRDARFEQFDIEVMIPDDPEGECLQKDLADTSVNVNLLKGVSTTRAFAFRVARRILAGSFDFVHSHGFTSGIASSGACRVAGAPHLVTPHDVVLDWQYRTFKRRVARMMIGMMLRRATRVQAVGHAAAENLRESFSLYEGKAPRIDVIRNGIDVAQFIDAGADDVRARLGIPADAIVVGFFGRFMAQKGFRYLVDAVEIQERDAVSKRPIFVAAVGGGGFRREEEELVRAKGLGHRFRFVDFTPNVAGLIKGVDVVAMPSLWEACPLLPMEAMTAGVPLVVTDFEACVEVAEDSPALVVPTRNADALLQAIVKSSRPDARERAQSFRVEAARRFDVKRTIDGVASLYGKMVA